MSGSEHSSKLPDKFWHCAVLVRGEKRFSTVNDLSFDQLQREIVLPWLNAKPFSIAGTIIRSADRVEKIKIAQTPQAQQVYAERHYAEMRAHGIADMATDPAILPISHGKDYTFELLFSGAEGERKIPTADLALVERVCKRAPHSARILCNRKRKGKKSYVIEDEYDVQDLLQALLRAYLKYSVQEDPLQKVAGVRSGRADLSIEELGILIEVKYARRPEDQRRIFDEFLRFSDQGEGYLGASRGVSRTKPRGLSEQAEGSVGPIRGASRTGSRGVSAGSRGLKT